MFIYASYINVFGVHLDYFNKNRLLQQKYLVILFSELVALMKFSALEIAGFLVGVNLTCFPMTVCLISLLFKTEYERNVLVQSIQYQ